MLRFSKKYNPIIAGVITINRANPTDEPGTSERLPITKGRRSELVVAPAVSAPIAAPGLPGAFAALSYNFGNIVPAPTPIKKNPDMATN